MSGTSGDRSSMVKVVYFDDQTASDYLDISAGGSAESTTSDVQARATAMHGEVESKLAAKLSWLPFLGASAEAGVGMEATRAGQSILSKTLSNTILTDYLSQSREDDRVRRLRGVQVIAPRESMAFAKMYTPYLRIARTEDQGIDLARLDEALEKAKGYYELLAVRVGDGQNECVLRFNIAAFRNNYGLADLGRMSLVFDAFLVGHTTDLTLSMDAELSSDESDSQEQSSALELLDGPPPASDAVLDVYDVVLAGVEHVGGR